MNKTARQFVFASALLLAISAPPPPPPPHFWNKHGTRAD